MQENCLVVEESICRALSVIERVNVQRKEGLL